MRVFETGGSVNEKTYFSRARTRLTQMPRILRMVIGLLLLLGGILGFLPILGFWMIPLGLMVLSYDLPLVRRWRRRLEVWWGRRRRNGSDPSDAIERQDQRDV